MTNKKPEEMTEEEWRKYCLSLLKEILNENVEIFKRLKNL